MAKWVSHYADTVTLSPKWVSRYAAVTLLVTLLSKFTQQRNGL